MNINRGDIWIVNLDPTVGVEIRKTRPVVVVNSDAIGVLPIRLVAPITEWKEFLVRNIWHVKIEPDTVNGLTKPQPLTRYNYGVLILTLRYQTWDCFAIGNECDCLRDSSGY